jgi:2-C-methyl-D-erythritol 2,4-cyclodiphosphate synthase
VIFVGFGIDIHQYSEDSLQKTEYREQSTEYSDQSTENSEQSTEYSDQRTKNKEQRIKNDGTVGDGATGSAVEGHSDLPSAICHLPSAVCHLKLYGLSWPEYPGLVGDSDADAGLHSIIDALLSGSQKGDIGQRFGVGPDANGPFDSLAMLKLVMEEITQAGFRVVNLVSQCICNEPRISQRKLEAQELLAEVLQTPYINVSGKTPEGMFSEKWRGVYAISTALLEKKV